MCGRFVREVNLDEVAREFGAEPPGFELRASYNIAPSAEVAIVVEEDGARRLKPATWGFVPHWARDRDNVRSVINARAETLSERPFFRGAFAGQRCVVVATGFFEWRADGKAKTPVYIRLKGRRMFGMAGLYSSTGGESTDARLTAAIVTVESNDALRQVHDRMPAILTPEGERIWLSAGSTPEELDSILLPYPSDDIEFFDVSRAVNSPANDSPENITPAA